MITAKLLEMNRFILKRKYREQNSNISRFPSIKQNDSLFKQFGSNYQMEHEGYFILRYCGTGPASRAVKPEERKERNKKKNQKSRNEKIINFITKRRINTTI